MLRITSSEFVISAAKPAQFPKSPTPEVAFAGRSNVGKSSLLNSLVNRKGLAKTSSTPGKTQQINFFRINDRYHFVDLPGYGYAKVSKTEREAWVRLIESYLADRPQLKLVAALSDIRHEPTALDIDLFGWLDAIGRPFVIVLTKYDKVSPAAAQARYDEVMELTSIYPNRVGIIPFSSQTRHNREALVGVIGKALEGREINAKF